MMEGRLEADTAVVGAGPVGCAAALAMANQGARVVLLEGNPNSAGHRLAGELLHPSGVGMLQSLGVDPAPLARGYPNGRGFVVFPDDGSRPVTLSYEDGRQGLTCDHGRLVGFLRQAAAAHERVEYLPHTRVLRIEPGRLICRRQGQPLEVLAGRLIGATGRSPLVGRYLGAERPRRMLSGMAGLTLEDAEVPCEGFSHIFLGAAGPLLLYRINERQVRLCCDFPLGSARTEAERAAFLWQSCRAVLPPRLRASFEAALGRDRILYSANYYLPRVHYGWGEVALVGDAAGYAHPLTATGITLGFGDVACLAQARSIVQYRRSRLGTTCVPEILAHSLYEVFTGSDPFSKALRQAVFNLWRQGPEACRRTVRLLAIEDTHWAPFCRLYLGITLSAVSLALRPSASGAGALAGLRAMSATLLPWLLAPAVIAWSRRGLPWSRKWKTPQLT